MTLVTDMEKRNTKFSVPSSGFPLFSAPLPVPLLFLLFCDAHWAAPATVEGSGNGICSLGRLLRTGFPHLCVCARVCVCCASPAWGGGWLHGGVRRALWPGPLV